MVSTTVVATEGTVARSPWPAAKLSEQIAAWQEYRRSPQGANLSLSGFPYLVLARVTKGDEVPPHDPPAAADGDLSRYDGYAQYISTDEEE